MIEKKRIPLPLSIWIIGRSGSGKTTTAYGLCDVLMSEGYKAVVIDGDIVRRKNKLTGYTMPERLEIFKEYIQIGIDMQERGIIPITATLCGYKSFRDLVKASVLNPKIIYLDCSIDVARQRDTKGLYEKAIKGEVLNFFGVDIPYEIPRHPDFKIRTDIFNELNVVKNIRRYLDAIC